MRLAVAGLLALACACGGTSTPTQAIPPNVVLIVLDTTRPDHLSVCGAPRPTTPRLERFAASSVVFRNAHSVAPWTLPAHMSMFTGLYPGEHTATWRVFDAPDPASPVALAKVPFTFDDGERLLARRMQAAGYITLGVSSNPWVSSDSAFGQGFDWFCDTWRAIRKRQKWYASLPEGVKTTQDVDFGRAGRNLVELRRYFATHDVAEPFFVFFNFVDPHFPYSPPERFRYRFDGEREVMEEFIDGGIRGLELRLLAGEKVVDVRRFAPFYDSELLYVDTVLGHLFDWLVEQGYDDNTMIVITSDHGEHLGEGGRFSHQLSVEEELLRVPLIVRFADRAGAGTVVDHLLVSNMDVYETILAAAGAPEVGVSRPARALDLGRMEEFDRGWLLAESYFSRHYLGRLKQEVPDFDVTAHELVRRAVYTAQAKYVFHDGDLVSGPEGEGAGSVVTWLGQYLRDIEGLELVRMKEGESHDPEHTEVLRGLGY